MLIRNAVSGNTAPTHVRPIKYMESTSYDMKTSVQEGNVFLRCYLNGNTAAIVNINQ